MGSWSLAHFIIYAAVILAQVWPLWVIGRKLGKSPAVSLIAAIPFGLFVALIYYAVAGRDVSRA